MLPKTPAKGMRDFLPAEFALRQYVLSTIQSTYESYGFSRIETPAVENIALLTSKQGGDNEKLIFKILKRGEKLKESEQGELCDLGLRYDLTVPLARFYANNAGQLPAVFKAMQLDSVWRADRPQRGRFRQFVPMRHRRYRRSYQSCGNGANSGNHDGAGQIRLFRRERAYFRQKIVKRAGTLRRFFRTADARRVHCVGQMDKVGVVGVMQELEAVAPDKAEPFINLICRITAAEDPFALCAEELGDYLPEDVRKNLEEILYVTNNCITNGKVSFDVTLVRGMGYYTGTIYEISVEGLTSSVAGGGRYDKMIGRITGTDVPACGFSIGFERIVLLLQERGFVPPAKRGMAVLVDKNMDKKQLLDVEQACRHLRERRKVTVLRKAKNFGYQLKQLAESGCDEIYEFRNGKFEKLG